MKQNDFNTFGQSKELTIILIQIRESFIENDIS